MPFTSQLKYIIRKYEVCKEDKESCHTLFEGRRDLAKSMHGFALGYLRHLRAFHMPRDNGQKDSIADLLSDFINMLFDDDYESLNKLDRL